METMKIAGREYPVLGCVTTRRIPLVDLHQMSDARFQELAVKSNVAYFTTMMGRAPVDTQEAADYVNKLLGRATA